MPERLLRLVVCALTAAVVLAACGDAERPVRQDPVDWAHEASDLPPDPAVTFGVLPNGMRYAILPNDTPSDAVSVRFALNAGSLLEEEDQRGLAHFVEHMAFNGTTNVPEGEMVQLLERYGLAFGADTNASTSFDFVSYRLDVPGADEERLKAALFLMRETASELLFEPQAIEDERGIILGEERFRNTPILRYQDAYLRFLLPRTIIPERMPIGLVEVVREAPRERFVDYYREAYRPERALLAVVGDLDPAEIERMIKEGFELSVPGLDVERAESFASWTPPETPPEPVRPGEVVAADSPQFGYFYDPDVLTFVNIDIVTPEGAAPDTRANRRERVLRSLAAAIVQRRLQADINSGDSALLGASVYNTLAFDIARQSGISGVASPERWTEALAEIEQATRAAMEHGFTQAELDEQLANVRTAVRNAADQADTRDNAALANALVSNWLSGEVFTHPRAGLAFYEEMEPTLTLEAVEDAFRDMWTAAEPRVFVASNVALEDGAAAVQQAFETSRAVAVDPPEEAGAQEFAYTDFGPPGALVSTRYVEDLDLHQYAFENGVRLNVKQTDFEDSVIRLAVEFGAGDRTPPTSPAIGSIVGAVFGGGGLEAHDADALQRLFAGRSVSWGLGVSDDAFVFSNATTPEDFELQMQILAAFMTAPGWREDGLRRFRAAAPEIRRNQNADANQVAGAQVSRMLRSGDPRWGFPTEAEVDAFTMEAARAWLSDALAREPVEITIVGDVEPETARAAVASTFAALAPRETELVLPEETGSVRFPDPVQEPVQVRYNGRSDQARIAVYWPTADASDVRRARAASLLSSVLRLKATDVLREREGATYSPGVSNVMSETYPGYGYMGVSVNIDTADAERVYALIEEIAAELADGGLSEDEMTRARQPILEQIEKARERNGFWLQRLSRSQTRPEKLDEVRSLEADYQAVTREEVEALAREWLQPERAWRVSILPREEAGATAAPGAVDGAG